MNVFALILSRVQPEIKKTEAGRGRMKFPLVLPWAPVVPSGASVLKGLAEASAEGRYGMLSSPLGDVTLESPTSPECLT